MSSSMSIICGVLMTIFAANAHDMNTGYQPPPPNYGPVYPPQQAHTHAPGPVYPQVTYPPVYPPQGDHTHGPAYPPQGPRPTGGCQVDADCPRQGIAWMECIPELGECFHTCAGFPCEEGYVCAHTFIDAVTCSMWSKCPKLPNCVKATAVENCQSVCAAKGESCGSEDITPTAYPRTGRVTTNPMCTNGTGVVQPPTAGGAHCRNVTCTGGQVCVMIDGKAACVLVLPNVQTCATEKGERQPACPGRSAKCEEDDTITCTLGFCTTYPRCVLPDKYSCPKETGRVIGNCERRRSCKTNTDCISSLKTQCCPTTKCGRICRRVVAIPFIGSLG